ncbi:MAG TPA: choice-of-anchor B family protein [Bacteroidia bacterium]|jgi:choice-of-anchor B domain-containing protein|nr:choice-of-anchor B family protein [Bacteroidia bacterium]
MKNLYNLLSAVILSVVVTNLNAQSTLNVTQQAHYTYPNHTAANICGYTTASGEEYALVGVSTGMDIVDVTVPNAPVHIIQIPNVDNEWKEIKVYSHYAYVTTEANVGLQIVDLNALPSTSLASYSYHYYTGDGAIAGQIQNIHSLHIDTTKGYCYLNGSNLFNGGCIFLDLNVDPYNPTYVGKYQNATSPYVHDCYVDNDTMYACHIYAGFFSVVDVTNKANPVVLATQTTTTAFTHNAWPSNGKHFLFTTDENSNSYLTAYDISDLNNIQAVDKIQSEYPQSGSIVHNTHVLNNWAITSWYRDGFVITDITRPHNLVNVGWYDMYTPSSQGSGNGFNGTWGVYPFFPSGTIVCSNIEDGLYVYSPTYVRACYLEGTVKDSICGSALSGVDVTIGTVNVTETTDANGVFATGTPIPGTYSVTFSKPGYTSVTLNNVSFAAGQLDTFNIRMYSPSSTSVNGNISNNVTTNPVAGAQVYFQSTNNSYLYQSNGAGDYSSCNMVADNYNIETAAWGYEPICSTDSVSNNFSIHDFALTPGYHDDFTMDLGWSVTNSATLATGAWVRDVPQGTMYNATPANPGNDVNSDCFDKAYVTGNTGTTSSDDDVDGGSTQITSPAMDLSAYNDPWIHYYRWFFNNGGAGNPNDSLIIKLTNGTTTVNLEVVTASTANNSTWVHKSYRVSQYMAPSANMHLLVYTADQQVTGHIVEAGFDNFFVADSLNGISSMTVQNGMDVYPNPFNGTTTLHYTLSSAPEANAHIEVMDVTGRMVSSFRINSAEGYETLGADLNDGIYYVRIVNGTMEGNSIRIVKTN